MWPWKKQVRAPSEEPSLSQDFGNISLTGSSRGQIGQFSTMVQGDQHIYQ